MLHFAVTGKGAVLLVRNGEISDISEGLAVTTDPEHATTAKVFEDIANGTLMEGDTLIITTPELFTLFSHDELLRYTKRFSHEELVQFLKTALINECDIASTFVVAVGKQEQKVVAPVVEAPKKDPEEEEKDVANAFSGETFEKDEKKEQSPQKSESTEESDEKEGKDEKKEDYVDKRTGHIYILDDEEAAAHPQLGAVSSKLGDLWEDFYYGCKKGLRTGWTATKTSSVRGMKSAIAYFSDDADANKKMSDVKKGQAPEKTSRFEFVKTWIAKIAPKKKEVTKPKVDPALAMETPPKKDLWITKQWRRFRGLSYAVKVAIIVVVLLLLALPLILRLLPERTENVAQPAETNVVEEVLEETPPPITPTVADGSVLDEEIVAQDVVLLNDVVVAVTDTGTRILGENAQSFALPDDAGAVTHSSAVTASQLLFLVTENGDLYSFDSKARKFEKNSVTLPEKIDDFDFYTTNAYFLDKEARQIYRYAATTGGFRGKSDWVEDQNAVNFDEVGSMAINEHVYLASNEQVTPLTNKKKSDFTFPVENITIDLLFTHEDSDHIFALDRTQAKITQFSKGGRVVSEFVHPDFQEVQNFSVDKDDQNLLVATKNMVKQFSLNSN